MVEIIILGASGFIGGNLFKNFLSDGEYDTKGFSSLNCNLLFLPSIYNALSSINSNSVIIMTSSITRHKEDSFDAMIKNIRMAENISRFLEKTKISQLVFLSTADVYGSVDADSQLSEKLIPTPDSYYGISKLCSELILKKCCSKYKIPLFILRLPGVYGPGDKKESAIGRLIDSALKGKVTIFGDGKDKRDFVYVDDIYKIIKIGVDEKLNENLNIVTGKSYSITEIVEIIKSHVSNSFKIEYKSKKEKCRENKVYNSRLLKKLFPNLKFIDIKEGISLYMKTIN